LGREHERRNDWSKDDEGETPVDDQSGRRNEKVRRVMASYIDEIVVWPSTKTGVLRVNAALAGILDLAPSPCAQKHNVPPSGGSRVDAIVVDTTYSSTVP
jgi:hypothetical protein